MAEAAAAHVYAETGTVAPLDSSYVGRLKRGAVRWPKDAYRQALWAVLGASDDDALGLTSPRPPRPAPGAAPVALVPVALVQPGPAVSPRNVALMRVELGLQLRELRLAAGMSQRGLATRLSYSRPAVSSAEIGIRSRPRRFRMGADATRNAGGVLVKAADELDHAAALERRQREAQRRARMLRDAAGPLPMRRLRFPEDFAAEAITRAIAAAQKPGPRMSDPSAMMSPTNDTE